MLDNQLIQLFRSVIEGGLLDTVYAGIPVISAYQSRQEGAEINNAIYFHKINESLVGYPSNNDIVDTITGDLIKQQSQWYESVFQISALVALDPLNINAFTASDLIRAVSFILQNSASINYLFGNGVGIYKITEIRNPYFTNEYGRYQASPSFDITFTHKTINTISTAMLESIQSGIYRT
jgi:hypothetical protein